MIARWAGVLETDMRGRGPCLKQEQWGGKNSSKKTLSEIRNQKNQKSEIRKNEYRIQSIKDLSGVHQMLPLLENCQGAQGTRCAELRTPQSVFV